MNKLLAASERLALSREHLRRAMQETSSVPAGHDNPILIAGNMAADAVQTTVQPIAQRHPFSLVLGAAVAGALLSWFKPWRWLFAPAVVASLLPQILSAMAGGTRPQSWLRLLTSLLRRRQAPGSAARHTPTRIR